MSLLWRVPALKVVAGSHGSPAAEVVFDKVSSWASDFPCGMSYGSQWFSRQVSRRLKMSVGKVSFNVPLILLQRSFHFMPTVADVLFALQLAVSGSAQPSRMSLMRSQKASRRKAQGFESDLLRSWSCTVT